MNSEKRLIIEKIEEADVVVIGAGSGLSTAGGLTYSGERFEKYFSDFIARYGLTDMYSSGFYPFETPEELWAYWCRHALINRFDCQVGQVYYELLEMVKDKDYFVLTTNVDQQFLRAGFESDRIFATQGDYGMLQCKNACHNKLYESEALFREMSKKQVDMKIPSDLVPYCPVCGEEMDMNLRKDDRFVEDTSWHETHERYQTFINENQDKKILFLELGVGMNTPVIIKYPFWRLTHQLKNAYLISMNKGQAWLPDELKSKSLTIDDDIGVILCKNVQ